MNGEQLYEFYTQASADNNIGVDTWSALLESDQIIWERTAQLVYEQHERDS